MQTIDESAHVQQLHNNKNYAFNSSILGSFSAYNFDTILRKHTCGTSPSFKSSIFFFKPNHQVGSICIEPPVFC